MASASYTQSGIYYYTSDHIGRPFNLRDADQELTWHEHHLSFGEPIHDVIDQEMSAGSGDYLISWKPNFRFPGQYQDPDMGLSATSTSLIVQNHYREYMPVIGIYNRPDPLYYLNDNKNDIYNYSGKKPVNKIDLFGLSECLIVDYQRICVSDQAYYNIGRSMDESLYHPKCQNCTLKQPCFADCIRNGYYDPVGLGGGILTILHPVATACELGAAPFIGWGAYGAAWYTSTGYIMCYGQCLECKECG
jgi:RHS repeat-associated protein